VGGGRIYGQLIDDGGALVGDNLELTPLGLDPSSPNLVAGETRLGLLFNRAGAEGRALGFRSFDFDFGDATEIVELDAENPDAATITANAGRFIVAWHIVEPTSRPGPQIWGSVLDENGHELISERPLTEPAEYARYHSIVPLGDRLILFWSEWHDSSYGIYSRELTPDLEPLGDARPVTRSISEAFAPLATFGPQGEIVVLFTGRVNGAVQPQVLFTSVSCDADPDLSLPR
jgi:hypothetical protein